MAITNTLTGVVLFTKPTKILVTPLSTNESGKLTKGSTTYALDNIVADSTSITQDEADRNTVDCETRDEPIYEAVTLGSYQFTCDNADWQDDLVVNLLGFSRSGTDDDAILYAPSSYKETFVEIEIQFGDAADTTNYKGSVVLPKVLLSSSATLESLKTSTGNMTVSGTAYTAEVSVGTGESAKTINTPFYISPKPVASAS